MIIRFSLTLVFCLTMMSCTRPIDLKIPVDHPANPQASPAPSIVDADYRYRLPP